MVYISVIVPVYNAEKYLHTCLDSLLNQGLSVNDYEIILVNDGSTDGSLAICSNYQNRYSNIFVITQENQGVSVSRNTGIRFAKGEWIMFVDSDDFICENSLRYLYENFCSKKYDGIRFWCRIRNDASIDKKMDCKGQIYFEGTGFDYITKYGFETFCVTMLYRKDFIMRHELWFSQLRLGEDFLFASQYLIYNPRICSTSCKVYQYLIHKNSASTSRNEEHSRKCAYDHLKANDELLKIIKKNNLAETNNVVYEKCINVLQGKMPLIFSRILSSNISLEDFRKIIQKQKQHRLLPIRNSGGSMKSWLSISGINMLTCFPLVYPIFAFIYSRLFVPLVLPRLNRNR